MASISLRKPSDSPRPSSSARAATSAWKNSSASTRASNKPADRRRIRTSQTEIKECRHDALTVTVAVMCSKLIADFGTLPGGKHRVQRPLLLVTVADHDRSMLERWFETPAGAGKRFKWSSFSHQNQIQRTRIDRVRLEAVNRPVPCKHKGIRQFSEIFGKSRVKARTLQGVAGSNPIEVSAGEWCVELGYTPA